MAMVCKVYEKKTEQFIFGFYSSSRQYPIGQDDQIFGRRIPERQA